jgi:hypothetical protein
MAWQQRSSGHNCNSPSGHALMVGALSRKPLLLCVKSKVCLYCSSYKKKFPEELEVPPHECWKNHLGSSKSMEAQACLELTIDMFDKKHVIIMGIVLDDDSSTKSMVRWSNKDWMLNNNTNVPPKVLITRGDNKGQLQPRPNKGKLPRHIPEPAWLHDPNHRKRVLTGDLYKIYSAGVKNKFTMTKMDIVRIGKNYGYMIRSLNLNMTDEAMTDAAKAVLEHHFDNHHYCSNLWCRRKMQTPEERLASVRYYRCKTKDTLLYNALLNVLSRFLTVENLREVAHGLDTQMNESFNNSASWMAPKNKVYCGSGSLTNRISMALGINALGSEAYFTRLYACLGITMTPNVIHAFKTKGDQRLLRLQKMKTREAKTNRRKRKNELLANEERKARAERAKREGNYRSGMNMEEGAVDGYTLDELLAAAAAPTVATAATKNKRRYDVVCPRCQLKGHTTIRSKHCLMNPKNIKKGDSTPPPSATDTDTAVPEMMGDADRIDACPLQDDPPSDASDLEAFFDADSWSDSESNGIDKDQLI